MSDRSTLVAVALVLAVFGGLAVLGAPGLSPGDTVADSPEVEPTTAEDDSEEETENGEESTSADEDAVPSVVRECAVEPPDDFGDPADGNEAVGWVDGFWYNEPLDIDAEDGITEAELENLSARTAARFETMRCITADDGVPPVEIQTREEFQDEQSELFESVSAEERAFDNAKLATLLIAGEGTDAIDAREANRGATVGGTYNFIENEIVIVSDDPDSLLIDEEVLAHELGHAIQDQQFNLSQYERPTVDQDKGTLGLIEGDVHLIEQEYLDACVREEWDEPCITQTDEGQQGDDLDLNWGLYFKNFQPYSDGPNFVDHIYESGGWEAVNDLYEDPPTSALDVIKPERFGEIDRPDLDVSDQSSEEWEQVSVPGMQDYDEIGPAGISAMFMAPTFETVEDPQPVFIYPPERIQNITPEGTVDDFNPFNYRHPETESWRADRFYAYENEAGDVGGVWEVQWESDGDWEPFADNYDRLAEYRGAETVEDSEYTYDFTDEGDFEGAVTIIPDGDSATVVYGPSVDVLDDIHGIAG